MMRRGQQLSHLLQRGGLRRAVAIRLASQRSFVETNHDIRRTLYLAGSRRSGTSWLGEVLSERYRCRFVLEPFRYDRVPGARWFTYGRYLDPQDPGLEAAAFARRVLTGHVRSIWADRENKVRLPRHRLVKDVWQNPLVPWFAQQFPEMPIVYILRHPLAGASSAASMRWDLFFESLLDEQALFAGPLRDVADIVRQGVADDDPVVPHVVRWCVENAVMTRLLERDRVHVLFFEELAARPDVELGRIDAYLAGYPGGRWRPRRAPSLDKPSLSDYRNEGVPVSADERVTRWTRELPAGTVDRCLEVVAAFGLDRLYGRDPWPRVEAGSVLATGDTAAGVDDRQSGNGTAPAGSGRGTSP